MVEKQQTQILQVLQLTIQAAAEAVVVLLLEVDLVVEEDVVVVRHLFIILYLVAEMVQDHNLVLMLH